MLVDRSALFGTIQIYHVNPGGTGCFEALCRFHVICGNLFHGGKIALEQADTVAVLDINCR